MTISILITLPPRYPDSAHVPQLQLLNRYIGNFSVDSNLFGRALRTYLSLPPSEGEGVPFTKGEPALWEGLEHCRSICQVRLDPNSSLKLALTISGPPPRKEWYTNEVISQSEQEQSRPKKISTLDDAEPEVVDEPVVNPRAPTTLPAGIEIHEAEPITDRKSVFVGRAVCITDISHVRFFLCTTAAC